MRAGTILPLVLLVAAPAGAGELVFSNGSRLAGELLGETVIVSTGTGLIEVSGDEIVDLGRNELRLKDGRVLRGTLVGSQIRARTALGEIAVKLDELAAYHAEGAGPSGSTTTGAAPAASASAAPATPQPGAGEKAPASAPPSLSGGPVVASYQALPDARAANGSPAPSIQPAALTRDAPAPPPGRRLEIVDGGPVYRDALQSSAQVGHLSAGQQVSYIDSIDRRLWILNRLVFDGGHWVKVRAADGTEGWVPAVTVRAVR